MVYVFQKIDNEAPQVSWDRGRRTSECATAVVLKMRPLEGQESKLWSSDLRRGRDQKFQCSREREGVRAHLVECVHQERGVQNFDVGVTSSVY